MTNTHKQPLSFDNSTTFIDKRVLKQHIAAAVATALFFYHLIVEKHSNLKSLLHSYFISHINPRLNSTQR